MAKHDVPTAMSDLRRIGAHRSPHTLGARHRRTHRPGPGAARRPRQLVASGVVPVPLRLVSAEGVHQGVAPPRDGRLFRLRLQFATRIRNT